MVHDSELTYQGRLSLKRCSMLVKLSENVIYSRAFNDTKRPSEVSLGSVD